MGNLSEFTKIIILGSAGAFVFYLYSPMGKNFIKITKYIRTMQSPAKNTSV
jgi:hypothetical protein